MLPHEEFIKKAKRIVTEDETRKIKVPMTCAIPKMNYG